MDRFTTDQVLAGVQAFVRAEVDRRLVLDAEASVYDYYKAVENSHECPLMFLEELGEYLGLAWSERRWAVWLRLPRSRRRQPLSRRALKEAWRRWESEVAPQITVRDLAAAISQRAPGVLMAPTTILGRRCAPAGAFLGLTRCPELRGKRVAPSTQVRAVLGGHRIAMLWNRAAWISGVELPPLQSPRWWSLRSPADWIEGIGNVSSVVASAAAGVSAAAGSQSLLLGALIGFTALCA